MHKLLGLPEPPDPELYQGTPWEPWIRPWYEPRQFLDGDLAKRLTEERGSFAWTGRPGHPVVPEEVRVILEAYRTPQYRQYIRGLCGSFMVPASALFPVRSVGGNEGSIECALCGKGLLYWSTWKSMLQVLPESEPKERSHLAYGAPGTRKVLCLDCLMQLRTFSEFLNGIEGDDEV